MRPVALTSCCPYPRSHAPCQGSRAFPPKPRGFRREGRGIDGRSSGRHPTHPASSQATRPISISATTNRVRSAGGSSGAWRSTGWTASRDYADHLRTRPVEMEALTNDLLIGVTEFFRDPGAFEALAASRLPRFRAGLIRGPAGPGVGRRLLERRGGLLDRDLFARILPGRLGPSDPDLRHRPERQGNRQGRGPGSTARKSCIAV